MSQIDYKNLMIDKKWDYIKPNEKDIYFIRDFTFDDDSQKYEKFDNQWIKFAKGSGCISLYNLKEPTIIIHKIHIVYIIHTSLYTNY